MKRALVLAFVALIMADTSSFAQSSNYDDDIYVTKREARKKAKAEKKAQEEYDRQREEERQRQQEAADNNSYDNNGDDVYIDYDDDDYYSKRFNSFGTYSFYRPYWYDPWYSPYYGPSWGVGYGWNSWGYGSGWSMSVGYGGPYWSSYWGYNNWYGYPAYYSCWNYPHYGYGWGGYGGGYYNGYWDGYYNGAYASNGGGYGGRQYTTYGTRTSMNSTYTGLRSSGGRGRGAMNNPTTPVQIQRGAAPNNNNGQIEAPGRGYRQPNNGVTETRPVWGGRDNSAEPARPVREPAYNSGANTNTTIDRPRFEQAQPREQRMEQPRNEQRNEQPRYEQAQPAQQQRYEQPRQQSQPSYNPPAPSRGGWGSGSSGGNSGGGSRGGTFGGGRR